MQVEKWSADPSVQKRLLARAVPPQSPDLSRDIAALAQDVRARGDAALRDYTKRFDGVDSESFRVPESEAAAALERLSPALRAALEGAQKNIAAFHEAQKPRPIRLETAPGVRCEMQWRAIEKVGLYVPGGTAPLFSTVLMLAVPARLAGCARAVLCAPPQKDGKINDATLAAARLCGVTEIFALGGAQAVAAMAYGTQSVPKVDKIFGPGNLYVTAAKQFVSQDPEGAAIDMPAGPSEVMVLAGPGARAAWVAADLLAQAEHDALAQAILVAWDASFAEDVRAQVQRQAQNLPRKALLEKSLQNSRIILASGREEAVEIANAYAPEHLILHGAGAEEIVPRLMKAGSVFVGDYTPETAGDYASGTNHVLPTYGFARAHGGLTLLSFMRSMTVQSLTQDGLRSLGPSLIGMAEAEGLAGHAAAVTMRLSKEEA